MKDGKRAKLNKAKKRSSSAVDTAPKSINDEFIDDVAKRLSVGRRVHRRTPGEGFLHIEGHLPYLVVFRGLAGPDQDMAKLVVNEAAYITTNSRAQGLRRLISTIASQQSSAFGAFSLVEIWAGPVRDVQAGVQGFRIHIPRNYRGHFDHSLQQALYLIKSSPRCQVTVLRTGTHVRPRASALLSEKISDLNVLSVGIEVGPSWRGVEDGRIYPKMLRELVGEFSHALRFALYEFACHHTRYCPIDYQVLGRTVLAKAVWEVDRQLAEVADEFDLLLQVTPINAHDAWLEFLRNGCKRAPILHYRPLASDPIVLKRRLYDIGVERINDPAVAKLFREKVLELDREISLLSALETPGFLLDSLQLFGTVGEKTQRLAQRILAVLPPRSRDDLGAGSLDARAFAEKAQAEIEFYRAQDPELTSKVEIRADVSSGLMVSKGNLLIGHESRIPAKRAAALLQHEIGTHMLTFHNGRAQPMRQLYTGLAGYDVLQEGLAVFAEYLCGGLSGPRLRLLAARVVAGDMMIKGAEFAETFDLLHTTHGFSQTAAFNIAIRLYRGGGLTKDQLYLDGLQAVFDYVGHGGDLQTLLIGKFATTHIPIMRELRLRGVLVPPRLTPRYLTLPECAARLARASTGVGIVDLIADADFEA